MGRLEAAVESLELKWVNYRDEMKKLVNRLEKREQRLEQKLRDAAAQDEQLADTVPESMNDGLDDISRAVLARRNGGVL